MATTDKLHSCPLSRRKFLQATSAGALGITMTASLSAWGADKGNGSSKSGRVVLSTFGGSLDKALRESYLKSFTDNTGVEVALTSNASLATLKLQVEGGHPQIDCMVLSGTEYAIAQKLGLISDLNYSNVSAMLPEFTSPAGYQYDTYAWGIVWAPERMGKLIPPRSWADFWNTERYPGLRSLYDNLADGSLLEAALLADGVAMKDLYPINVPRALASLTKLGKNNIVWYSTNDQPIQQITSGQTQYATAFSGRVYLSNRDQKTDLGFVLNESAISGSYLVVLKNAPNLAEAKKLLDSIALNTEGCVNFANTTHYGCVNKRAYALMPPALTENLPGSPQSLKIAFVKNTAWWANNLDETVRQFRTWQRT